MRRDAPRPGDQQGAGPERPQQVAQAGGVGLVRQQAVGDDEAGTGGPGIDPEAAQAAHFGEPVAVDDRERKAEFGFQFVLPLHRHGRWGGDHREVNPPTQQQLAQDQPGLDRLAEAHIVGDEQIHARQAERLAQRQELVGIEADATAERRLEQVAVGRGGRVPLERPQIGREGGGIVGPVLGESGPDVAGECARTDLRVPGNLQGLALGVVGDAGQLAGGESPAPLSSSPSTNQGRLRTSTKSPSKGFICEAPVTFTSTGC